MNNLNIMLCCGAGFSSGFLAQKTRQAAKKRKLNLTVEARSESLVSEYVTKVDMILIGPHYKNVLEGLKQETAAYGVIVDVIPSNIYSKLNGDGLLDFILKLTDQKDK